MENNKTKKKRVRKNRRKTVSLSSLSSRSSVAKNSQRVRKSLVKRVSWSDDVLYSDNGRHSKSPKSNYSSSGTGDTNSEFVDPSILVRGPSSPMKLRYSKDELLSYRSLPLSKMKPSCLDVNSRGCWDPDRWDKKHQDAPAEDERIIDISLDSHKRRSDPRERIRKEQDGIVLSPQRRSFNTGCYMPAVIASSGSSGSGGGDMPLTGKDPGGGRRIGSGRILTRDSWDFRPDKPGTSGGDASPGGPGGLLDDGYSFRPGGGMMRDRDDRYERRSYSRDFDKDPTSRSMRDGGRDIDRLSSSSGSRGLGGSSGSGSRYSNGNGPPDRSRGSSNPSLSGRSNSSGSFSYLSGAKIEVDEPEWFSGGPTSQHDTIELRGFEDIPEDKSSAHNKKQRSGQQKKVGRRSFSDKDREPKDQKSKNSDIISKSTRDLNSSKEKSTLNLSSKSDDQSINKSRSSTPLDVEDYNKDNSDKSPIPEALQNDSSIIDASLSSDNIPPMENEVDSGFALEDFLSLDSIPGLLSNGASNEATSSRFSQFFRRESPVLNRTDSRRSSFHEELNNMLTDPNKYFTPISPAGNSTNSQPQPGPSNNNSLLEMLQRARVDQSTSEVSTTGGKIHNVEELEARMRHGEGHGSAPEKTNSTNNKHEEMAAFQKLLSQVSGNQQQQHLMNATQVPQVRPMPKPQPPMSILEMLNKSQQADENAARNMANAASSINLNQMGAPGVFGPVAPTVHQQAPPQVPPELVMKLLQVQQFQRQQQQQQQQQIQQQQLQQLSQYIGNSMHNTYPNQNLTGGSSQINTLTPEIHSMLAAINLQPQHTRDLLQRPEAQAIIQGMKQNKISVHHLVQQLGNPAMQQRHREMLVAILKTNGNVPSSRNLSPAPPPPQNPDLMQNMMLGAQQQLRVSPLPNAYCVSPILATSPNTLSVHHPAIPPRMPSPMELQAHTRNIMQGALIKKKLEEQSENFRKRQEMQRSQSPTSSTSGNSTVSQSNASNTSNQVTNNSPAKHIGSPTPLAFTPTSVLRKMTAEKEPDSVNKVTGRKQDEIFSPNKSGTSKNSFEADPTANGNMKDKTLNSSTPARTAQNLNQNRSTLSSTWSMGRPIVKGGVSAMGQPIPYASSLEMQMQSQYATANMQARTKLNFSQNNLSPAYPPNMQQYNNSVPPNATTIYGQNYNSVSRAVHAQQQHLQHTNYQHPQMLNNSMINSGVMGFNQRDGALSPTSNQLARWFSPELLAQASAGKLPPVNLAQNALSLEELERIQQSSTTVHN